MKDFIESPYPDLKYGHERTSFPFRLIVLEAWNSNSGDFLENLLRGMPMRCQAVFDAHLGGGGCYQVLRTAYFTLSTVSVETNCNVILFNFKRTVIHCD